MEGNGVDREPRLRSCRSPERERKSARLRSPASAVSIETRTIQSMAMQIWLRAFLDAAATKGILEFFI
jgi:hypothetical protein